MSNYLTDEERELKRLAEAATPGPWVPWCDHQPSLEWLCNDKDGVSIVTLGEDGFPDVRIADADVERTEEESASWTTTPANKPVVAANVSYIAAANPKAVLGLLARIEALERKLRPLCPDFGCNFEKVDGPPEHQVTRYRCTRCPCTVEDRPFP